MKPIQQVIHYGLSAGSATTSRQDIFIPLNCFLAAFQLSIVAVPSAANQSGPAWAALLTGGVFLNGTGTNQSNVLSVLYLNNYQPASTVFNAEQDHCEMVFPDVGMAIERGSVWRLEVSPGTYGAVIGEVTMFLRLP
jgi:hypothetical protein